MADSPEKYRTPIGWATIESGVVVKTQTNLVLRRLGRIMDPATPRLRKFARRLLALESAAPKPADANEPVAFRVCDNLRRTLGRLAGVAGFRSLLARALALASKEVSWLKTVQAREDGSLKGLEEAEAELSQSELARGEAILIAQLIALLVNFIGEALTLRLVQESWTEVTPGDLNPGTERKP